MKISSVKSVLKRAYKKFSWRINENTRENNWLWKDVKAKQKEELKKEHNLIYKK